MSGRTSVVLGANGFIGTRLQRRLAAAGDQVTAVDLLPPRETIQGVRQAPADVRAPLAIELGQGAQILYNLAAVHRTPGHPDHEYYDTNVAGALHAVQLAEACGISTIVFTSSISVYGPSEDLLDEAAPLKPVSAYGRSKRLAEVIHQRWARAAPGRKLVIVRPGVVFGPGERGNYSHLAKALSKGYFLYPGRRDTIKSGGYVDELLRAIEFALTRPEPEILFNYAYPDPSTTEDIVQAFERVCGFRRNPPTLPIAPLLVAASVFEGLSAFGVKTPIHRQRVMKLVQSTRIEPGWLKSVDYHFSTRLESALEAWRDETSGTFS